MITENTHITLLHTKTLILPISIAIVVLALSRSSTVGFIPLFLRCPAKSLIEPNLNTLISSTPIVLSLHLSTVESEFARITAIKKKETLSDLCMNVKGDPFNSAKYGVKKL